MTTELKNYLDQVFDQDSAKKREAQDGSRREDTTAGRRAKPAQVQDAAAAQKSPSVSNPTQFQDALEVAGTGTLVPEVTRSNLVAGDMIAGRYQVIRQLGAGGMGRVLLANDRQLKRDVAIKLLRESITRSAHGKEISSRFEMEAVLPAGISHPNIVTIFDKGDHNGAGYFVMEYLEGSETMGDWLRRHGDEKKYPPLDEVKEYFRQAAEGLSEIHSHDGVWHRDIKTDNFLIFRRKSGQLGLKILDFGIVHSPDSEMTQTGVYLGTPSYIAPESFAFDENDHRVKLDKRADLFALGVAMYLCLTLRKPYPQIKDTLSAMETYRRKDTLPQKPSELRPDLPQGWDYLVLKLLERDHSRRYQSAQEVLADLSALEKLPEAYAAPVAPVALPKEPTASELATANLGPEKSASVAIELTGMKNEEPAQAPETSAAKVPTWRTEHRSQEAAEAQKKTQRTLAFVAMGGAALLVVGWLITDALGSMSKEDKKPASSGWNEPKGKQNQIAKWEEEIEKQREKPLVGVKTTIEPQVTPPPVEPRDFPKPEKTRGGVSGLAPDSARKAEKRAPAKAGEQATAPGEGPQGGAHNDYAALYGSGAAMNSGALVLSTDQAAGQAGAPSETKGLKIPVVLVGDVASQPNNSPVVARINKAVALAGKKIPAGSEIHGMSTGASGLQVLVNFSFVRLADGTTLPVAGVAKDTGGRLGIPGKKNADLGTASSVVADTVGAVGQAAGDRLAGAVDDTIGQAGLKTATGSAARKSDKLDLSENVVVSRSGTRFIVYLTK